MPTPPLSDLCAEIDAAQPAPTGRERHLLHGGMGFAARQAVVDGFLAGEGGVLIASMEAGRSSVNLRGVRHVVMPVQTWTSNLVRSPQEAPA